MSIGWAVRKDSNDLELLVTNSILTKIPHCVLLSLQLVVR